MTSRRLALRLDGAISNSVEVGPDEVLERVQGLLGILAHDPNDDLMPFLCAERHDSQDTLAVHLGVRVVPAGEKHVGSVALSNLNELRRGSGVETVLVGDEKPLYDLHRSTDS